MINRKADDGLNQVEVTEEVSLKRLEKGSRWQDAASLRGIPILRYTATPVVSYGVIYIFL